MDNKFKFIRKDYQHSKAQFLSTLSLKEAINIACEEDNGFYSDVREEIEIIEEKLKNSINILSLLIEKLYLHNLLTEEELLKNILKERFVNIKSEKDIKYIKEFLPNLNKE